MTPTAPRKKKFPVVGCAVTTVLAIIVFVMATIVLPTLGFGGVLLFNYFKFAGAESSSAQSTPVAPPLPEEVDRAVLNEEYTKGKYEADNGAGSLDTFTVQAAAPYSPTSLERTRNRLEDVKDYGEFFCGHNGVTIGGVLCVVSSHKYGTILVTASPDDDSPQFMDRTAEFTTALLEKW